MIEQEVLSSVSDAVNQQAVRFEIDVYKRKNKRVKKRFEINPLTLSQLQRISKLLLPIDLKNLTANGVLTLMNDHSYSCAEIVAIAVTPSRKHPSKKLIELFFSSLSRDDMETALKIVLQQMNVINFINTIASIRSLNVLETKQPAIASGAEKKEASPIVPGSSSEA